MSTHSPSPTLSAHYALSHSPIPSHSHSQSHSPISLSYAASPFARPHSPTRQLAEADTQHALAARDAAIAELEAKNVRLSTELRIAREREETEREKREREGKGAADRMEKANGIIASTRAELHKLQDTHLKFTQDQRALTSKLHYDLSVATERAGNLDEDMHHMEQELQALKEEKNKKDWKLKDQQRELTELDVQILELKNQLTEQSSFNYLKVQVAEQERQIKRLQGQNTRMTSELATMRDATSKVIVLEEEKRLLESRLAEWFDAKQRIVELEMEIQRMKSRSLSPHRHLSSEQPRH